MDTKSQNFQDWETQEISLWNRVLLGRLTDAQLLKKDPAFYWAQRYVQGSLIRVPILCQMNLVHTFLSYFFRYILILFFHLHIIFLAISSSRPKKYHSQNEKPCTGGLAAAVITIAIRSPTTETVEEPQSGTQQYRQHHRTHRQACIIPKETIEWH